MKAREAGVCGGCGRRYERGEEVRTERNTGQLYHRQCLQVSRRMRPRLPEDE